MSLPPFQQRVLEAEMQELKAALTGDLFQDMETRDKIHQIEMKLNGVQPEDGHETCEFCSG